ncbi:hypothetical protein RD792_014695 [Penstemon davidsonii]|uniref:CTLH domain-containing protein n=1 Tax=Penstemon davidsonii TaxID=160366 RepID=A0ABR0CQ66_9LAMI|nr:hypothetical protein RD792_014695 [Penstemon davidsonii]
MKIFFEIRKQKYLEALDRNDRANANDILMKDLRVFSSFNEEVFKELTQLLALDNFREKEKLSKYVDAQSARAVMFTEVKKLLELNPLVQEKLTYPHNLKKARLRTLINQSLNWQHRLCKNPNPNPQIKTLFEDHLCAQSQVPDARAPSYVLNPLMGAIPRSAGFPPLSPAPGPWMTNTPQVPYPSVFVCPIGLNSQNTSAPPPKRPRTPSTIYMARDQTVHYEHGVKRTRPFSMPNEANSVPINVPHVGSSSQTHGQNPHPCDDLPTIVMMNLNQGAMVKSVDFHPTKQILLLVGTSSGVIMVWELGNRNKIFSRSFNIWDLENCSMALQIEAHIGSVNDIAFTIPNKHVYIITCGDDKLVKVWDAVSGENRYIFKGHEAPVNSVYPHTKKNVQFVFSTAIDGKIKAWLYDNQGSIVDYDAPGHSATTIAYNDDGTRFFSFGTNKECDPYLVEWNENEGSIKHIYLGLLKRPPGIVQFDTTKNILAVGDNFMVKFWDMDNVNLLATTYADGGLSSYPCICFNNEGVLLAVSTNENGVKILANKDGVQLLKLIENRPFDASRVSSVAKLKSTSYGAHNIIIGSPSNIDRVAREPPMIPTNRENRDFSDAKSRTVEEYSHCRSLRLTYSSSSTPIKVSRLTYTNSGFAILALASNGVHKLWKWPQNYANPTGKANANNEPMLWEPNGLVMTNDISNVNSENVVPCIALSKHDSYVISSSGGKVSLFNMMTFKTLTTFTQPPPTATSLAFHPQDYNIIAIGMDDSSIQIYNVQIDKLKTKLYGHQRRVTSLAFSNTLNVLVSSGADSKLCLWSADTWERKTSKYLQMPPGRATSLAIDTCIQFHRDEKHLLAVHEAHIAVYEAPNLSCIKQWVPLETSGRITYATYSCNGQSIYVSFEDGSVGVLTACTLRLRCRINPSAYLPANPSLRVYPLVIAVHPTEQNQFALGLTDGGICVLEPLESEGKWGTLTPPENCVGPSTLRN